MGKRVVGFRPGLRRYTFLLAMWVFLLPLCAMAHQAPYSIAYLDVSPNRVSVELHIPLTELELAFGHSLTKDPAASFAAMRPLLEEYILAHTHAYVKREQPWLVGITSMTMDEEQQVSSGPPFWELKAHLVLTPQQGDNTRKFMFDYDAVVHQVINHIIFVVIRSDWETGRSDSLTSDSNPMTIRIGADNRIHPLAINLDSGNLWTGFSNMVGMGMEHIKEGTDHLLFLLTLLLPAPLLVSRKKWAGFGGTRYSLTRLLKIVTAFTVGHSITLLLGATGLFVAPAQPVELLIAISILISAIHAFHPIFPGKEYFISGGFGLVHGMAFASVLTNMNLGGSALALSILGFNIGIELMQLFIVVIIIPWLLLLSQTPLYRGFRMAGAIITAIISIGWIMERSSGQTNYITEMMVKCYPYAAYAIACIAVFSIISYTWNIRRIKA